MSRRDRIAPVLTAPLLAAAACVTNDLGPPAPEAPVGRPVVIPFATPSGNGPADAYYKSILAQMHEAYLEHNADHLAMLLDEHDVPRAPAWAREILARYRALLAGLRFEDHVAGTSRLQAAEASLGDPVEIRLSLPPQAGIPVTLGAEDDAHPTAFRVTFDLEDRDSRGDVILRRSSSILRLPEEVVLAGDLSLELPFTLEEPALAALIRSVTVRVELMPGYVRIGREQVPHNRIACAETELTLYPPGVEPIRRAPRITLLRALDLGDVDHFPHVFLAAHFMSEPHVEEAMSALIEWVRLGSADQQQVAMAGLSMLADADIQVGDRSRWLEWWQHRKKG